MKTQERTSAFRIINYLLIFVLMACPLVMDAQNYDGKDYLDLIDNTDDFNEVKNAFENYWNERPYKKGEGYKPINRWINFMEPRVYPSGKIPNPSFAWHEYKKFINDFQNSSRANYPTGDWQPLGPTTPLAGGSSAPGVGRVNCIAVDPNDNTKWYVGTAAGGLWRTTNSGSTWVNLTDNLPVMGVSDVLIDHNNSDVLYLATGDADNIHTYSIGILKSTNGGQTWFETDFILEVDKNQKRVFELEMDPVNPAIIYAATTAGLLRSTNGASSWDTVQTGRFTDVKINPDLNHIVYAITARDNAINSTIFYRSMNGGSSFFPTDTVMGGRRTVIGVSPASDGTVYLLSCSSSGGFLGLHKSTSFGSLNSFALQSNSPNIFGGGYNPGSGTSGQGNYDIALAVDPNNVNNLFMGGIHQWKSTDGGQNWTLMSYGWNNHPTAPYVHADVHDLNAHDIPGTLFSANDGGVFVSNDAGTNWVDVSAGLAITQFYRLGGSPTIAGRIYGGTQDNGLFQLSNGTWSNREGGDWGECVINYNNQNIVYSEFGKGYMRRSTDGGQNFNENVSPPGYPNGFLETGNFSAPIAMHPINPNLMYMGRKNVWLTGNGGVNNNWVRTTNFDSSAGPTIVEIEIAPSNTNKVYFIKGDSLFRSDAAGLGWTNVTDTIWLGLAKPTSLAISGNDPDHIFLTLSGYMDGLKVVESTDGGASWMNISRNLPNIPANCIVYQNGSDDGIYVGTDVGVYYLDDGLIEWQYFSGGLPNVIVSELEIFYLGGLLRAATYGRGIWETDLYTNCLNNLNVTSVPAVGNALYESATFLTSNAVIDTPAFITFTADNYIDLTTGFSAAGGSLVARLEPCNVPAARIEYPLDEGEEVEVANSVGVEQPDYWADRTSITCFPNPILDVAKVSIQLASSTKGELFVTDIAGRLMYLSHAKKHFDAGRHDINLDLSNLETGLYLVQFRSESENLQVKVMKAN